MAKILFGAGVADARNKLGGHVFSKNRNGAYLRMKVSPSQPRSPKQLTVRSVFGLLSKAWGGELTASQRDGWISLAASNPVTDQFGNPQILTGLQMYQKVNRNLHTIGVARLDDAPADQAVEGLDTVTLTVTVTGTVVSVAFTPTPLDANMHLVLALTPPLSPGRTFLTPFFKLVSADTSDATASPVDDAAAWTAIFGPLQAGQLVGVSAYVINETNGAASTPAADSAITGA